MFRMSIAFCLMFLLISVTAYSEEQPTGGTISERLITRWLSLSEDGELKNGPRPSLKEVTSSPNSKRLAYIAEVKYSDDFVVLDGVEGRKYESIYGLTFSPDSRKLAYRAAHEVGSTISRVSRNLLLVLDGVEGEKKYDSIPHLTFSPDSTKLAYIAKLDDKQLVVLDGVEEEKHDDIINLTFSQDSEKLAYVAETDGKWSVVLNGEKGKQYDSIGKDTLIFSPDSKRMAYTARTGDKWFVVVDGQEEKQYNGIMALAPPKFSPDSKRLVYAAKLGTQCMMILDGREGKQYDGVGSIFFSLDSKRIAFTAIMGGREFVVLDGEEQKHYDGVSNITFSPDSKRIAYAAKEGGTWFHVVDGKEPLTSTDTFLLKTGDERFATITEANAPMQNYIKSTAPCIPLFSPDSKRLAVRYQNKKMSTESIIGGTIVSVEPINECVVIDGKMHKTYTKVKELMFSPNSEHIAYLAFYGTFHDSGYYYNVDRQFVVKDGEEIEEYRNVSDITFSPDSKKLACMVKEDDKVFVVVDGKRIAQYDDHYYLNKVRRIIFDSPNTIYYFGMKGNSVYLVEQRLE